MNRIVRRAMAVALTLPALLALTTGMLVAGEEGEPLIFELTLSGDVHPDDSFGIYHNSDASPEWAFIHQVDVVCSADDEHNHLYHLQRCEARTYRLTYQPPAGVRVEYAIAYWDESFSRDPEYVLRDSITVPEGGITLRLEYDYSGDSGPARPTSAPVLPDTAVSHGGDVPPALAPWATLVLPVAALSTVAWRSTRGASRE